MFFVGFCDKIRYIICPQKVCCEEYERYVSNDMIYSEQEQQHDVPGSGRWRLVNTSHEFS